MKYQLQGRVRWFNKHFGYGFIRNHGGEDVFVHHTVIDGQPKVDSRLPAHYRPQLSPRALAENEIVNYTCERHNGRLRALQVFRTPDKDTP